MNKRAPRKYCTWFYKTENQSKEQLLVGRDERHLDKTPTPQTCCQLSHMDALSAALDALSAALDTFIYRWDHINPSGSSAFVRKNR